MKSFIIAFIVAAFFFLALIFGARNEQVVTISYFVAQGEFRLPLVLASVFLAGFLVSWIFAMYHIAGLKLSLRRANKKLSTYEDKQEQSKSVAVKSTDKEVDA
ncbi:MULTISPECIES: LapA family protein [unclassified Shewanella]|uniref:LapA family protein n=1 Tax=unclassified Shewanella TaxID=196818 RepID=UPI001BBE15C0|nr:MULTISPECIES: lipopolysaccharide assembly protein LapA domain-containing protein [unclassified Shewanella]GIU17192.1 putative lipopolysaccharide assembly protein A [Shewanella sp. MBTL60-112-B1]GIU38863.1 putative lipopolysaccharide assembly protein A [Shewanella sp. MBTL60-112-B2]